MDQKKQEQVDIYNAQGGPPMIPIQPQPLVSSYTIPTPFKLLVSTKV